MSEYYEQSDHIVATTAPVWITLSINLIGAIVLLLLL